MGNPYNNLIILGGAIGPQTAVRTLLDGQSVALGQVLGKQTSGGKLVAYDSAGTDDGRRTFYAIAAETKEADGDDEDIRVYIAGTFAEEELVFANSSDAAVTQALRDDARQRMIILQSISKMPEET